MSVSVTITNLAAVATPVSELYIVLDAAGGSNEAVTVERSLAELDSMRGLKALVDAGTVSADVVQSADNVDLLSLPLEQHGEVIDLDVNATALLTATVTFDQPFPAGTLPKVFLTLRKGNGPDARGEIWVESVTPTGFDYFYDVTTLDSGPTNDLNWMAVL